MNRRDVVRGILTVAILAAGGAGLGYASEHSDVVLFTGILFASAVALGFVLRALGPMQKSDERAVDRSKSAALDAIRISTTIGILGGAYAQMLNAPLPIAALAYGMAIPAMIWMALYFIYQWRDLA